MFQGLSEQARLCVPDCAKGPAGYHRRGMGQNEPAIANSTRIALCLV